MDEQFRQQCDGYIDEDRIAEMYRQATAKSQTAANLFGLSDEFFVKGGDLNNGITAAEVTLRTTVLCSLSPAGIPSRRIEHTSSLPTRRTMA